MMSLHKASMSMLAGVALIAATGASLAQTQTTTTTTTTRSFTPDQQRTIYSTVTREQVATAPPAGWAPQVGVAVPSEVTLYNMPTSIAVPEVRSDRYTIVNERVVVVDPVTRQVIQVIDR
jgi:hypothetical protein